LPIEVRSALPLRGPGFRARSKLDFLWNSPEDSAASMRHEIAVLFDQMADDSRATSAA